ncbi:unnamed protein product [Victoria cruziana]
MVVRMERQATAAALTSEGRKGKERAKKQDVAMEEEEEDEEEEEGYHHIFFALYFWIPFLSFPTNRAVQVGEYGHSDEGGDDVDGTGDDSRVKESIAAKAKGLEEHGHSDTTIDLDPTVTKISRNFFPPL